MSGQPLEVGRAYALQARSLTHGIYIGWGRWGRTFAGFRVKFGKLEQCHEYAHADGGTVTKWTALEPVPDE